MSKLAIKAENISKQYRLGEVGTGTLSHDLNRFWHKVRGKENPYLKIGESNDRSKKGESDYVWSLKDINFEIEQGDAVGIIGRNGAGKSTLLKILSKVTKPTTGNIKVNGRIASLLEVGTGFNPEMTGRENIYLNGAILGMRKSEITRKLDEIVDFSGVERYLDTPVKRYSSGMYVRLAFAVAAHLESEILIVDEVLAVGDAEFQKKCLGKMGDVSKGEGRTVLFVSHNMSAIINLCNRGILLSKGIVENAGNINDVINTYVNKNSNYTKGLHFENAGNLNWWLNDIRISQNGNKTTHIDVNDKITLDIDFEGKEEYKISFELLIKDSSNTPVLFIPLGLGQNLNFDCSKGKYTLTLDIKLPQLALGIYQLDIFIVESFIKRLATFQNAISFEVISSYVKETGWNFERNTEIGNILIKVLNSSVVKNGI